MANLGKNAPDFEYRIVGVRRPDGVVEMRWQVLTASGDMFTLMRAIGPHGRIDASQLDDFTACMEADLKDQVIQTWGVQTVLG